MRRVGWLRQQRPRSSFEAEGWRPARGGAGLRGGNAGGVLPAADRIEDCGAHGDSVAVLRRDRVRRSCATFDVPEWKDVHRLACAWAARHFRRVAGAEEVDGARVPHEHLDIGFTDYREKVAELQSQSIDGVLDLLPEHPEFRWTMDGSWVAQQYLAGRSPERVQQFLSAIRAGKIVMPPQYANQHTGVASLEGLTRSLYPSHAFAEKFKLPVGAANITDVPSYSWSVCVDSAQCGHPLLLQRRATRGARRCC